MKAKGESMATLAWIGLIMGLILIGISISSFQKKEIEEVKKVDLRPSAPVAMVESQEAINARVKMSAEIASLTSHFEEMDRKLRELEEHSARLAGEVNQMASQIKSIESRPVPTFPSRVRLDVVNYRGRMKGAKKVTEKK